MIVKGSAKIHNTRDRFVTIEWGEDENTKQGVIRLTTCDGRIGREITVEDILRDAKMYEAWPNKSNQ